MRRIAAITILLLLCAESARSEESGREATLHLRDGSTRTCVVKGYKDDHLEVIEKGQARQIDLGRVKKVTFGKAVGDGIRTTPEPEPVPADNRMTQLARFLSTADTKKVMDLLGYRSHRFRNGLALGAFDLATRAMLLKAPPKGTLRRNLFYSLAVIKAAQARLTGRRPILARRYRTELAVIVGKLTAAYGTDPKIVGLTAKKVEEQVAQWEKDAPPTPPEWAKPDRPQRGPGRGPRGRDGERPRRDRERPGRFPN
jgi:hypothetical protein